MSGAKSNIRVSLITLIFGIAGSAPLRAEEWQPADLIEATHHFYLGNLPIQTAPHSVYSEVEDTFAEVCAVSQYHSLVAKDEGGPYGHATLFFKGACLDKNSEFPQLKTHCDGQIDEVGISANSDFRNLNWVGAEGYDFVMNGEVSASQALTEADRARVIQKAFDSGVFRGMNFYEYKEFQNSDPAARQYAIGHYSTGTEYALNFGRNVYCYRIPLSERAMATAVDFLNRKNQHYYHSHEDFQLDWERDNCSHLTRNALASIGLWQPRATTAKDLVALFLNLSTPMEVFEDAAGISLGPVPSVDTAFYTPKLRALLLNQGMMLPQEGSVIDYIPIHGGTDQSLNTLFDLKTRIKGLDLSIFRYRSFEMMRTIARPPASDLLANFKYYEKEYARAVAVMKKGPQPQVFSGPRGTTYTVKRSAGYLAFFAKYREYLIGKLALVRRGLAKLEGSRP